MKCPYCNKEIDKTQGLECSTFEYMVDILKKLYKNPKSTRTEIHIMIGGLERMSTPTLNRVFRLLEQFGYISDVGKAIDVKGKHIKSAQGLKSRVYVANIRIIRVREVNNDP